MNNNSFEKEQPIQESSSKEDLVVKLQSAEEKYWQLLEAEKKSEFYDKEMYDSFLDLRRNLGPTTPEFLEIYIGSAGGDYQLMLENYNKQEEFIANILKPIRNEIFVLESEIRKIDQQELGKKKEVELREAQEKFQKEKDDIEIALYEALDKIHQEIPNEAHEAGMKTDIALKTYKPDLVDIAKTLEWRIEELSSIRVHDLKFFKEKLKRDNLIEVE